MKNSLTICRKSDRDKKLYFRSERFFQVGGQWYFMSREIPNVGPYKTLHEAKSGLASFLKRVSASTKQTKKVADTPKINTKIEWVG